MSVRLALLSLFATGAWAASSSTVSLFFPGGVDKQSLVASVVGANPTMTTYVISCPTGTSSDQCGFDPAMTITQGPTTAIMTIESSDGDPVETDIINCTIEGTTRAVCTANTIVVSSGQTTSGSSVSALSASDVQFVPVVVTAGVEKLSSPSATGTAASSTAASSSTASAGSGVSAASPSATGTGANGTALAGTAGKNGTTAAGSSVATSLASSFGLVAAVAVAVGAFFA